MAPGREELRSYLVVPGYFLGQNFYHVPCTELEEWNRRKVHVVLNHFPRVKTMS